MDKVLKELETLDFNLGNTSLGLTSSQLTLRNVHPFNNNNNIHICIAPYGRNFRGAGPGSVLVGVRRGKRVSLGEEKCL